MNNVSCTEHLAQLEKLKALIDSYRGRPGGLIPVLQKAQELFGCLSVEVQQVISEGLRIPLPEVYGVVTFYSQFTMERKGKHQISVCLGTACYIKGAQDILQELKKQLSVDVGETSADGLFTIDATRCIGACGLAPVITIGKDVYGRLEPAHIKGILDKYRQLAEVKQ